MTELIAFLSLLLVAAGVLATFRDTHDDGYGRRLPPPSHHPDPFDPAHHLRG